MSCNGWRSPTTCERYPATDGEAPQLVGDVLQRMEKPRNLWEMSCNGWRSPSTCGRCPEMDGETP